jgi:hypothetical protein
LNAEGIEAERLIGIVILVVFMAELMLIELSNVEERILMGCRS